VSRVNVSRGYALVGTDTGVGKTLIGAALARRLKLTGKTVVPYKPVQSGGVRDSVGNIVYRDADLLSLAIDGSIDPALIAPWVFDEEIAPFVLLEKRGKTIGVDEMLVHLRQVLGEIDKVSDSSESVCVVEGAGGVAVPLTRGSNGEWVFLSDIIRELSLMPVIVTRLGLGTINLTLLTIEYLRSRAIEPIGVVLTQNSPVEDPSIEQNPVMISRLGKVDILGVVPYQKDLSHALPSSAVLDNINSYISWPGL
jgi:dethiobiotin synthetase